MPRTRYGTISGMMKQKLIVEFTKMNGAGNDFIIIDNRFYHFTDAELSDMARTFCPRRTGIGADGVLALSRSVEAETHFRMRYVNADGSSGTMCGNGARCLARFARLGGIEAEPMLFETDAGVHRAWVPEEIGSDVELELARPRDFQALDGSWEAGIAPFFIWTGTEHIVAFVDDLDSVDVASIGPVIRSDERLAPRGANVNFVEVVGADVLRVRTYEKGVEEETPACGTGAVAAAVVAFQTGRARASATIQMPGGALRVSFEQDGDAAGNVRLAGPADVVYRGTLEWG